MELHFKEGDLVSTPIYIGAADAVEQMMVCEHEEYTALPGDPDALPDLPECRMQMEQCHCGALRVRITGPEEQLQSRLASEHRHSMTAKGLMGVGSDVVFRMPDGRSDGVSAAEREALPEADAEEGAMPSVLREGRTGPAPAKHGEDSDV